MVLPHHVPLRWRGELVDRLAVGSPRTGPVRKLGSAQQRVSKADLASYLLASKRDLQVRMRQYANLFVAPSLKRALVLVLLKSPTTGF